MYENIYIYNVKIVFVQCALRVPFTHGFMYAPLIEMKLIHNFSNTCSGEQSV